MLIEIHMIQNHAPSNLNRDDLGAPKTCYFGGVLRSRISSQCLKRSIRTSQEFSDLLGGIRTRQLARLVADKVTDPKAKQRAEKIFILCGIKPKKSKEKAEGEETVQEKSKMLIYTTNEAIDKMAALLNDGQGKSDDILANEFAELIANNVYVPDMALCGRMLEPEGDVWKGLDKTVEAALQAAHAISTHEARPEVDYYVAKDDVPGEDAGAGFVDEAMYASACFYKYFSIDWEQLMVKNLNGNAPLAAHTVGAFLRGAALVTPSGKQNSYSAHNRPEGILVEIRSNPISYANAFATLARQGDRSLTEQSIAQLGQYAHDMDAGYGGPAQRFWFSPNMHYPLKYRDKQDDHDIDRDLVEKTCAVKSLDELTELAVKAISGLDWQEVQRVKVKEG
jgi:CRISPR system Cascade subunit CasC